MNHAILILLALIAAIMLFGRKVVGAKLWEAALILLLLITMFYLVIGGAALFGISVGTMFWITCGALLLIIIVGGLAQGSDLPRDR